jgi:DNA-binding transcriptional regulator YdaS (Cro superfamily)
VTGETLTPLEALNLAVTRIGSQAALARLCDVKQPSVWHWLNESKQLPAEHVLKVEAATGVSRHDLRPDLYPRGLQDDVPFRPALNVGEAEETVADETPDFLQPGEEWPLGGEPHESKAAAR